MTERNASLPPVLADIVNSWMPPIENLPPNSVPIRCHICGGRGLVPDDHTEALRLGAVMACANCSARGFIIYERAP